MSNRLSIYLEQEILSAGRLQLIHLLYQAAITEIRDARRNMAAKRVAEKCSNINKACAIVTELRGSLNHEEGGEIALRLEALYNYILSRLLDANLRKLDEPLGEVIALLSTLDEAWKELAHNEEIVQEPQFSNEMPPGVLSTSGMVHSWSL
jgi:flagellar secretion chaperone FliS